MPRNFKKTKTLVTGASGFIGSAVVRQMVAQNRSVVAVVTPYSETWRLKEIVGEIEVRRVNLADEIAVKKLVGESKPSNIVHLATHGVYSYQQEDEVRIAKENYLMAANLLSVSREFGIERFINTGSVFEYGGQPGSMREEDVKLDDVLNTYSAVKMATTALGISYKDEFSVVTLRPFTAYGPLEDKSRFIMATILRALNNEPIRIVEGVVRDFCFVEDIADGFAKALDAKVESGEVINLGSGTKHSLEEAAGLIKSLTNSVSDIVIDKKYKRRRESCCWANISKAKRILGWKPRHNLKQGLLRTIDWARASL